jgi:pyridinium-3,5-bisthiocarboxylic acid mononucleotide nickel chelatase
MKAVYLDCTTGIRAERLMGAFINLGVDVQHIENELSKLKQIDYMLSIKEKYLEGFKATSINYSAKSPSTHLDNCEMESYKKIFNYNDMETMINNSDLNPNIKEKGKSILNLYMQGKARFNNTDFYSTTIDKQTLCYTMISVFGILSCITYLKLEKIFCSYVGFGSGFNKTGGTLVPFPSAVICELMKGIPVKRQSIDKNIVDEIGLCILKDIVDEFTDDSTFIIKDLGYGTSEEQDEFSTVVRVFSGETLNCKCNSKPEDKRETKGSSIEGNEEDKQYIIECNIDDMNSEHHDYVMKRLFTEGALDVYFTPIIMKKGRPAIKVSVLCKNNQMEKINEILFLETTTFGTRSYEVHKNMLKRTFEKVQTEFGNITVKKGFYKGKFIKAKPEYDECKSAAEKYSVPIRSVYNEVMKKI